MSAHGLRLQVLSFLGSVSLSEPMHASRADWQRKLNQARSRACGSLFVDDLLAEVKAQVGFPCVFTGWGRAPEPGYQPSGKLHMAQVIIAPCMLTPPAGTHGSMSLTDGQVTVAWWVRAVNSTRWAGTAVCVHLQSVGVARCSAEALQHLSSVYGAAVHLVGHHLWHAIDPRSSRQSGHHGVKAGPS